MTLDSSLSADSLLSDVTEIPRYLVIVTSDQSSPVISLTKEYSVQTRTIAADFNHCATRVSQSSPGQPHVVTHGYIRVNEPYELIDLTI